MNEKETVLLIKLLNSQKKLNEQALKIFEKMEEELKIVKEDVARIRNYFLSNEWRFK
jgi:hypothetical protein